MSMGEWQFLDRKVAGSILTWGAVLCHCIPIAKVGSRPKITGKLLTGTLSLKQTNKQAKFLSF